MVHLVQPWDVAMFYKDIADILMDRATRDEVISRNKGADLAESLAGCVNGLDGQWKGNNLL